MTFKSILFCLFLYVCLVWVGAYYLYSGEQVQRAGLLWTGAGLATALLLIIGTQLIRWWQSWRARRALRPQAAKTERAEKESIHEDERTLIALIDEANAVLKKRRSFRVTGSEGGLISSFPSYLLIGPENAGKTTTFAESGLEPQLLAGTMSKPDAFGPTRLCNIWLAKEQIFFDFAGRIFNGDGDRWQRLLRILDARPKAGRWKLFWNGLGPGLDLRSVLAVCDAEQFGTSARAQSREQADAQIRLWQERLGTVAEIFGKEIPVHVLVSKCDTISFFGDYFGRLPDPEKSQPLGFAVPLQRDDSEKEVTAEAEAKWLAKSFNKLYYSLADQRLDRLAHEPNPARRPAIYEFPRELKRLRGPLVQFLTMVFRPHALRPRPRLHGYYLSGTVERESLPQLGESRNDWSMPVSSFEASGLFRSKEPRVVRGSSLDLSVSDVRVGAAKQRWLFVEDLFQQIVQTPSQGHSVSSTDRKLSRYRSVATFAVCAICTLLCCVFLTSWIGNWRLLHSLQNSKVSHERDTVPTLSELQSLESLRVQISELTRYQNGGPPLSLRWGLYAGNGMLRPMRQTYFRRFQDVLLNSLSGAMATKLASLPVAPGPRDQYNSVFRSLRAYLMISGGDCQPDPPFVAAALKTTQNEIMRGQTSEWEALAGQQIDFYAAQLPAENPCQLIQNRAARDRARAYLANAEGIDKLYSGLLASVRKASPTPLRLADLAPAYQQVLSGPSEVEGLWTKDGWSAVEKASRSGRIAAPGETCVLGTSSNAIAGETVGAKSQQLLERMYLRDYAEHWRRYVAGFSVNHYGGPADAARKLEILSGHKSPLLALIALASNQTNFPVSASQPETDRVKPLVQKYFPVANRREQAPPRAPESATAAMTRSFQPVHLVVPAGSDTWVVDKNNSYVEALAALGHSMDDIARAGATPEASIYQAAGQNYDKALDAARQIARGFEPVGVAGLDVTVEHLLEAPIRQTQAFIISDLDSVVAGKVNGQFRHVCEQAGAVFRKYPFAPFGSDATLSDVAAIFAPNTGAIWRFQSQFLSELLMKEAGHWQAKDAAKKPQVTPEMVNFLNRSQTIADAFYPGGSSQPQLSYTLRPKLDPSFHDAVLDLEVDGQTHVWTSSLQKQFIWPPDLSARDIGVRGRIKTGNLAFPFASRGGIWAIFHVMSDAEPRALSSRLVEWKFVRGGDGRLEAIQPAPVRLEFVEFPGGVDIFNPKFLQGVGCPSRVVQ